MKTRGADAAALTPAIRAQIVRLDPALAVPAVEPFRSSATRSTAQERFIAMSLGLAAAVTLLVAAIGVYAAPTG